MKACFTPVDVRVPMDESRSAVEPNGRLPDVTVDCCGINFLDEISVDLGGQTVTFVFGEHLKRSRLFSLGLFTDKAVQNQAAISRYPRDRRACALLESPISACYRDLDRLIADFPVIFTHQQRLLERGDPFVPLLFGTNWVACTTPDEVWRQAAALPEKTALVSFMGSIQHTDEAAYRLRRQAAELALSRPEVHCYGKGIREVPNKREALAPYRFSVAMENAASDHYFSEKLIDCLLLETIPIYYGCPGIGALFDARGLLTFQTLDDLHGILDRLSVQLYEELRPYAVANRQIAVEQGWDSHVSLFVRVARQLPHCFDLTTDADYCLPSRRSGWRTAGQRAMRQALRLWVSLRK